MKYWQTDSSKRTFTCFIAHAIFKMHTFDCSFFFVWMISSITAADWLLWFEKKTNKPDWIPITVRERERHFYYPSRLLSCYHFSHNCSKSSPPCSSSPIYDLGHKQEVIIHLCLPNYKIEIACILVVKEKSRSRFSLLLLLLRFEHDQIGSLCEKISARIVSIGYQMAEKKKIEYMQKMWIWLNYANEYERAASRLKWLISGYERRTLQITFSFGF